MFGHKMKCLGPPYLQVAARCDVINLTFINTKCSNSSGLNFELLSKHTGTFKRANNKKLFLTYKLVIFPKATLQNLLLDCATIYCFIYLQNNHFKTRDTYS